MKTVRIGSRASALAVAQSEIVMRAIQAYDPKIEVEIVTMTTKGDEQLDKPMQELGGKAVFVKELEQALLDERVDICVHSLKDMEAVIDSRLPIIAVGKREDPRDALILPKGRSELQPKTALASSSLRRIIQLRRIFPQNSFLPMRGNIVTRIEKLDAGGYGGVILAAAGLHRLGLQSRISRYFEIDEVLPACGQGILAVQGRRNDRFEYLSSFHDADAWDAALAERGFVRALAGGCTSPVTAHAVVQEDNIIVRGYSVRENQLIRRTFSGPRTSAERLGIELGVVLKREAEKDK